MLKIERSHFAWLWLLSLINHHEPIEWNKLRELPKLLYVLLVA